MGESASDRRKRVKTQKLDESIAEKMQRQYEGKTVSWTRQERERYKQYDKLQRKDKQLEASLKQMEAADKQLKASESLQQAAVAIKVAMHGRDDARKNLSKANRELAIARGNKPKRTYNNTPRKIIDEAKRSGLNARGVRGGIGSRQYNYSLQFDQLHKDLLELNKRIFVVK